MVTERLPAHAPSQRPPSPAPAPDSTPEARATAVVAFGAPPAPQVALPPVDRDLREMAAELAAGKALDLGCGSGQNSLWLAQRGWVVSGVDLAPAAIASARTAAASSGQRIVFDCVDFTRWRPASRFDLVLFTYALPERGKGRSRVLEMAAAAVAPGGTIIVADFDRSLAHGGLMAEKYLTSTEELERSLDGFRIIRSTVANRPHRHGYEEMVLPAAIVVAERRTDLRTL